MKLGPGRNYHKGLATIRHYANLPEPSDNFRFKLYLLPRHAPRLLQAPVPAGGGEAGAGVVVEDEAAGPAHRAVRLAPAPGGVVGVPAVRPGQGGAQAGHQVPDGPAHLQEDTILALYYDSGQ